MNYDVQSLVQNLDIYATKHIQFDILAFKYSQYQLRVQL